jgi:hypothetical protein
LSLLDAKPDSLIKELFTFLPAVLFMAIKENL